MKLTFKIIADYILVLDAKGKQLFKVSNNVHNATELLKLSQR